MYKMTSNTTFPKLVERVLEHKEVRVEFGSVRSARDNASHIERTLSRNYASKYAKLKDFTLKHIEGTPYLLISIRQPVTNNQDAVEYLEEKLPW